MDAELVVNLWAIYDTRVGFVYGLAGKAYMLQGSEEEKLEILKKLSATDYLTAKRYEVPHRFKIKYLDGTETTGFVTLGTVRDPNAQLFEDMFKNIESDLPPLPDFSSTEYRAIPQKLPQNPLCITTLLFENEAGEIRPIVTEEDRAWAAQYVKLGESF